MKIAYLIYFDVGRESGVLNKIRSQIQCWTALGHQVTLFVLSPSLQIWTGLDGVETNIIHGSTRWSRNRNMRKLGKEVINWQPDIIYWRFGTFVTSLLDLFHQIPTVTEINTYDLGEKRKALPLHKYLYHRLTRGRLLASMVGLVCVTNELAEQYATFNKDTIVLGNSVNLAEYKPLGPNQGERPGLVFLGSTLSQAWHGVNKIILMATHLPQFDFTIIGSNYPVDLPAQDELPANLRVVSYMDQKAYQRLFAESDIGIATLALHRKSMNEACALKVRSYLASGLPVILASIDTDFLDPEEFILQLPNTEDNVLPYIDDIRQFVHNWHHRRIDRRKIQRIDVAEKEKQRLEFLSEFVNGSRSGGSKQNKDRNQELKFDDTHI